MDRVEKMERSGDKKKFWNFVHGLKPVMMMIIANVFFSGMSILYKIASTKGMSLRILIAYRFIIAAVLSLLIAFYTERKTRSKLTRMILLQAFSCALFGSSVAQNLFAESLVLTSATLATAIINLIPAATFILAIPFGEFYEEDDEPHLYPHSKGILYALKDRGIDIAIASRSPTANVAKAFLDKLKIRSMFVAEEIYSSWSHKTEHFQKIHRKTGIPFDSMLFFDDEDRNIQAVSKMGATSILVHNGVTLEALRRGLSDFSQKSSS